MRTLSQDEMSQVSGGTFCFFSCKPSYSSCEPKRSYSCEPKRSYSCEPKNTCEPKNSCDPKPVCNPKPVCPPVILPTE